MATNVNYIARLNERAQKKGWTTTFDVVGIDGPDHDRTFTIRAVVNKIIYPNGVGRNKKEARQSAAKNALSCMEEDEPASSETNSCSSDSFPVLTQPNFTCWLNEYGQKTKLNFKTIETTKMSLDSNNQQVSKNVICTWSSYQYGSGILLMRSFLTDYACMHASMFVVIKNFLKLLAEEKRRPKRKQLNLFIKKFIKRRKLRIMVVISLILKVPDENRNGGQKQNMSPVSSSLSGLNLNSSANTESPTVDKNFIGVLNQYCQKNNQAHHFKLVERKGPAHNAEFVCKLVMNEKEYPEGKGKSAKEAQQNAAELALGAIQKQSEGDIQTSSTSSDSKDELTSQTSTIDSKDDVGSPMATSINQNTSDSVVFRNSSVHSPNPVPVASPFDVKAKRRLAANFQMSPNVKKQETPIRNGQILTNSKVGTPASNPPIKSRFLENFKSISTLGKGGFGRVFKATNILDQKDYAVKIVKYTDKARREVGALAKLEHANIVRYHTSWIEETAYRVESSDSYSTSNSSEGDFLYIQMELCEGDTLRAWIDTSLKLKQDQERRQEAVHIMKQVLEAVKYVHSTNHIHRDLKPENIMLGKGKVVKVGDFGLVTAAEADDDEGLLERTKRTGTRSYMSPEQKSQCSYDRKVDIFALGLIYFELVWNLETVNEKQKIWDDVRSKRLPKDFSKKFAFEHKFIEQMLSANPEERPDARELLTNLAMFKTAVLQQDPRAKKENRTY
ncbi:interferon-induced, double-stranded RNA-activated protein kinase isoform X2 [Salminus brasiliensis]|uniref:interferon-induced, double-stranded RNA-activated protein kinase isoform X2 n=1 Tax=Salminus brasiliensis TaxID=930266 RepID=UPI003B82ED3E